jgi:hypothetical protein
VTFDASKSKAGSAAIQSYTFTFGDGTPAVTSAVPTVAHTFTTMGAYAVSVVVTDVDGTNATAAIPSFTVGKLTPGPSGGSKVGTTGLQIQVAIMDDHHHSGAAGTKPKTWCSSPGVQQIGPGITSGTAPILFYGSAESGGCGSGWDTPGVWIKNPTGAAVTVDLNVTVGATTPSATNAGNHSGSWSLWSPVTLQPGQSVIFAENGVNNFDPGDTNIAGEIGADPSLCAIPSPAVPVINVIVNGKTVPVKDSAKVLNTGGADSAGCRVPSPGSATRSDESVDWQNP